MLWCSTTEPQRLYSKRVHMTHVLHTIRINYVYSIMFVNRMREMLCKEIEKDGFCLVMSLVQRKNSESPWGIAPQTYGEWGLLQSSYDTHPAYGWDQQWALESTIQRPEVWFLTGTQNCFFVYWHLSNDSFKALTWNKIYLIYCMITSDQSQVRSG